MLIVCPNCASCYLVRAHEIGTAGRKVKCGSCAEIWEATAPDASPHTIPEETVPSAADVLILDSAEARPPAHDMSVSHTVRNGLFHFLKTIRHWLIMGGLAAALTVAGWLTPPNLIENSLTHAKDRFDLVWQQNHFRGLNLKNIRTGLVNEGGTSILVIEGEITSKRSDISPLPRLSMSVRNPDSKPILQWTTSLAAQVIAPGATVPFTVRLASPPADGKEVVIRFTDA